MKAQTPTPTWEPLYPTATPVPDRDYSCPEDGSNPVGWLTVTPSTEWAVMCSSCGEAVTPYPTWTPDVSGTPGTPVPTVDVTMTPTPEGGYDVEFIGSYAVSATGNDTPTIGTGSPTCDPIGYVLETSVQEIGGTFNWSGWSSWHTNRWLHAENSPSYNNSGICFYESGSPVGMCDEVTTFVWDPWGPYQLGYSELGISDQWTFNISQPAEETTIVNFDVSAIHAAGVCEGVGGTPTPEPHDSYCGTVEDGSGQSQIGIDEMFQGPEILLGPADCFQLLPQVEVPTVFPQWMQVSLSGITVCIRGLSFGEIRLLDLVIDLDWYSGVAAAITMVKYLLYS